MRADAGNAWDEGIFPWELLLSWAAGEKTMGYIREPLAGRKEFSSLFHKNPLDPTGQGDPRGPHSRAVSSTGAENSTENEGFSTVLLLPSRRGTGRDLQDP